jgi:hypothetical protein
VVHRFRSVRRRSLRRAAAFILIEAAALACGGGGGGTTTAPPTNPPTNPPPPTSQTVTLTLTVRSVDPTATAGLVYVYAGDATETRQRMPAVLNENAPALIPIPGQPSRTVTIQVPKGKFVTLFATELGRADGYLKLPNTPFSKVPPADATEFVGWVGATLATPEPGVATLKMDTDMTLVAEYDRMRGILVQFLGCPLLKYSWAGQPYMGFGTTYPNSGVSQLTPILTAGSNTDFVFAWGKQGTNYTFSAQVRDKRTFNSAATGFMVWENAPGCGALLDCIQPIPGRLGAQPTILMKNSYTLEPSSTTGTGCGQCDSQTPQGCSDFLAKMRP